MGYKNNRKGQILLQIFLEKCMWKIFGGGLCVPQGKGIPCINDYRRAVAMNMQTLTISYWNTTNVFSWKRVFVCGYTLPLGSILCCNSSLCMLVLSACAVLFLCVYLSTVSQTGERYSIQCTWMCSTLHMRGKNKLWCCVLIMAAEVRGIHDANIVCLYYQRGILNLFIGNIQFLV